MQPRFELCFINHGSDLDSIPLVSYGLRFSATQYFRVQKIVEQIRCAKAMGLISPLKIALVDVDLMAFVEDYNNRHPETVMSLKVKWSAFRSYRDVCSYPLYTRTQQPGLLTNSIQNPLRMSSQSEWDAWLKYRAAQTLATMEEYYALWERTVPMEHVATPTDMLVDLEMDAQLLTFQKQSDSPVSIAGIDSDGESVLEQLELLLSPGHPRTIQ
jgi:hypothetical protein